MFREVELPDGVSGRMCLHAMPARDEPWREFVAAARQAGLTRIVCLVSRDEIAGKSPPYLEALSTGLDWPVEEFPVSDFGVPEDADAFARFVSRQAGALRAGEVILVHCAAGIGRTGLFATLVLVALGLPPAEAAARVEVAGSRGETDVQQAFVARLAGRFGSGT